MLRFRLRHLIAVTTIFAILLAIGTATDALNRDGVWVVESIREEGIWFYGETQNGVSKFTGLPTSGSLRYIAKMRDADRIRSVTVGDDFNWNPGPLPKVGDLFIFTSSRLTHTTPLSPDSAISIAPHNQGMSFAVDTETIVLPAQSDQGYRPILNAITAFAMSLFVVSSFIVWCRFVAWLPTAIQTRMTRRLALPPRRRSVVLAGPPRSPRKVSEERKQQEKEP